jgi:hypothetical protein
MPVADLFARIGVARKWTGRFVAQEASDERHLLAFTAADLVALVPPLGPRRLIERHLRQCHPTRHSLDVVAPAS